MKVTSSSIKILCGAVLLTSVLSLTGYSAEPVSVAAKVDPVAQLQAELKATKEALLKAQEQSAQQSRRIAELESQLTGAKALPGGAQPAPAVDVVKLQQELTASKSRISTLEEELFVATDGKGAKGKEVVEDIPEGTYAWTENLRRSPVGALSPKTATIPKGDFYARFSHMSQNQLFVNADKNHNAFNDLMGLESGVKVGILFGYGITKDWDVTIQRTNGREYTRDPNTFELGTFDLWDVMTKYQFLDENEHFIDASASAGFTYFWQDEDIGRFAGNFALMAEKSIWRFRVGSGLLYTSLSTYESARTSQNGSEPSKDYPREYYGAGDPNDPDYTVAIPVNVSLALTKSHQLFVESAFPVAGYHTGGGASLIAGWSYNTPTHVYRLYFSNTANASFNSAFTGGYMDDRLDIFGFDISIFF
jgi:Membrane bound beta barrel domain (DUF5777)